MAKYRFVSNGGCARCEAMEGIYDREPQRPHLYCRCTIEVFNSDDEPVLTRPTDGEAGSWDRSGTGWTWENDTGPMASEDRDGDNYHETYSRSGYLYVNCCDGSSTGENYTLTISVDLRSATTKEEQDALMEDAFAKAEAEMSRRAVDLHNQDCIPCDLNVS